jgi:hypothetical protein
LQIKIASCSIKLPKIVSSWEDKKAFNMFSAKSPAVSIFLALNKYGFFLFIIVNNFADLSFSNLFI